MQTATAVTATLTILPTEDIRIKVDSSYAAWYTNYKVLPGTYTATYATDGGWRGEGFYAKVDVEVTDDYYASHFGGVPFGKYDCLQNAGKREKLTLFFRPATALKHPAIEFAEADYEAALELAKAQLESDAECSLRCIADGPQRNPSNGFGKWAWVSGHAKALTEQTEALDAIYGAQGRRAYNAKETAAGRVGWKAWNDTHVPKTGERTYHRR